MNLQEIGIDGEDCVYSCYLGEEPMTNPREQGTKPLGSVKCRKSLGQLNDTRPLNKNSVPKRSKAECT
jgi:hypothetical protein